MARIPRKTLNLVVERDEETCVSCGSLATQVHHIIFKSHSGSNDERNLILLCNQCHRNAHDNEPYWRDYFIKCNEVHYGKLTKEDLKL